MDLITALVLLFNIAGINAASGLHVENNLLYVISDNSPYLYQYKTAEQQLDKVLLDSTQVDEWMEKKDKKDFEAMCDVGELLVVVGSGSKPTRHDAFLYNKHNQQVSRMSLDAIYHRMREVGGIDEENFNIEGLAFANHTWYFLNRGNGKANDNLVFCVSGSRDFVLQPETLEAQRLSLPELDGYRTGFSDGVIVGDRLFFVATAEDVASTYEDGESKGSYISYLNLKDWTLGSLYPLSKSKKIEGLTLFSQSEDTLTFMLCEDPDDENTRISTIYSYDFQISSEK